LFPFFLASVEAKLVYLRQICAQYHLLTYIN
jgi:hypothetical protein